MSGVADKIDFMKLIRYFEDNNIEEALRIVTRENILSRDRSGDGVLVYLCRKGPDDPSLVRHFVGLGAETSALGIGWSPLQIAANYHKPKLLRALLDVNIKDVNVVTQFRSAQILYFSPKQHCECIRILVDAGSEIPAYLNVFLHEFVTKRNETRTAAIMILGLKRCRSRVIGKSNGGDVLRLIARAVWSTRGLVRK